MEQAQIRTKKRLSIIMIFVIAIPLVLIAVGAIWFYGWHSTNSNSEHYQNQIIYQFQDLNRGNWDIGFDGLPMEIKLSIKVDQSKLSIIYSQMSEEEYIEMFTRGYVYNFSIAENEYVIYEVRLNFEDFRQIYYIYNKIETTQLAMFEGDDCLFIKDNYIYYLFKSQYKSLNTLNWQTENVEKESFMTAYRNLVPQPIDLSENGKYKNERLEDKNTIDCPMSNSYSYDGFGFYHNENYYFFEYHFDEGNILCVYNATEETYTKVVRIGRRSMGHFVRGDYLYYCYGRTRSRIKGIPIGDPQAISQQQRNYARLSLITLKNETINESDYLQLYY